MKSNYEFIDIATLRQMRLEAEKKKERLINNGATWNEVSIIQEQLVELTAAICFKYYPDLYLDEVHQKVL